MTSRTLHKAACHPHKSENLVHDYWRYHSVERRTMRIKEVQEPNPGVHQLQNTSLGGTDPLVFTNWVRSPNYNRNHSNTVPPIPNRRERRESKIQWSRVSIAAERSRSCKMSDLFWSKAIVISLWTRIKTVSVLWSFLNAGWYKTLRPLASK